MSGNNLKSNILKEGEFYGKVTRNRQISSFVLSEVIHKKAVVLPEHSHQLAYFTLIFKGNYSEKFAGKLHLHPPMSIIWHRAGISHSDEIGGSGGSFFTIEFQPEYLGKIGQFANPPEDFFERNSLLVWDAKRIYQEFKNWQPGSDLIVEGAALQMLGNAIKKRTEEKHPPIWLTRIVNRLNEEFKTNFSIEELALDASVHPVHLASVFRQFYRENIGEYVQKLRINHASKLLLNNKTPISEIAFSTGFTDQSHFTRMFKRYVGTTPAVFRNQQN